MDAPPHPDWIVPDWPAPHRVRAWVTTRAGGASTGPWGDGHGRGGLNLGTRCGDDPAAVRANRARLRAALPEAPRWLQMEHGAEAVDVTSAAAPRVGDAAFTRAADVVCVVTVADCLPVFLCDRAGSIVGVAHAGWRGLAAGILQRTVEAMRSAAGREADLIAWLGPAIGPEAFEVGDEVRVAMRRGLPAAEQAFRPRGAKWCADLYALARQALGGVGVGEVYGGRLCTYAEPGRFYSHRRDRVTGRHAALIWLNPATAP